MHVLLVCEWVWCRWPDEGGVAQAPSVEYLPQKRPARSHHKDEEAGMGQGGVWHAEEYAEKKEREKGRGENGARGAVKGGAVQGVGWGRAKKKGHGRALRAMFNDQGKRRRGKRTGRHPCPHRCSCGGAGCGWCM